MKKILLIVFLTISSLAYAVTDEEVHFNCTSDDSHHRILPFGNDNILKVQLNGNFGGYMLIAGDAGIWSSLKYSEKENRNLIFISIPQESSWQAKNLKATLSEELANGKTPGEIQFTSLDDLTLIKRYSCH